MEIIGIVDAKDRLGELLERTQQGETFEIVKDGQLVGKLIPPDRKPDPQLADEAVRRLKAFGTPAAKATRDEVRQFKHEGHRY